MKSTIIAIAAIGVLLAGCSPKAMYDASRGWRMSTCAGTEAEVECRNAATQPYGGKARSE